jgi:hypothetical protein
MKEQNNLIQLSAAEMQQLNGGSADQDTLAGQLVSFISNSAWNIWEFTKQASEYQASLPANLKK